MLTLEQIKNGRLRAKQAQRPFRIRVEGASAHAKIRSADEFVTLIQMLRENQHFHPAVVEIEKLQLEIRTRRGVGLPVPEEVWQKPDPALIVCWGGASVIAFRGGIASLVGGAGGRPVKGITDDLLNALAMKVRLQG